MRVQQFHFVEGGWDQPLPSADPAQLVLVFAAREMMQQGQNLDELSRAFPNAELIGCSTSGEIYDEQVFDNSMVVSALTFERTKIEVRSVNVQEFLRSFDAGVSAAKSLPGDGLRYVFVLSDGQLVNGTELVDGISLGLQKAIPISGGLAGDGANFEQTRVWHNERNESGLIVICGLYGDSILCGHGTLGGWDAFGPERVVTHSDSNVLYSLDDEPALTLYKRYLGDYSKDLPSSALLFPLLLNLEGEGQQVVRTVLNVDESAQSMTFAGDIPQGCRVQLMRANFDRLIDGAQGAAESAQRNILQVGQATSLAVLISCVGRRLLLGPRTEEELEAVRDVVGQGVPLCGFYSYGEISPLVGRPECGLHNQTMTITTIAERES